MRSNFKDAKIITLSGRRFKIAYVYMETPSKKVRSITDKGRRFCTYGAANYVSLKDKHLAWECDRGLW